MDASTTPNAEMSLTDAVQLMVGDLPAPVQAFLRGPERDRVSIELSTKYNLHADQAGVFSRAYIYMLIGVYTPEEFVKELRGAGIAEATVQGLTLDVNERVFKRLQNEERTPSVPVSTPATGPVVVSRPMNVPVPPAPKPVPPPAPPIPTPIPAAAPVIPPTPAPFAPVPQAMPANSPIYVSPETAQPAIRTMAHDMEVLKEGEKHPHPAASVFGPKPNHAPAPIAIPVPTPAPAPIHQPSAPEITPVSIPSSAPAAIPQPISWQPSSPARSFQTSSVPNTLAAPSMHPAPTGFTQSQNAPEPRAPMPVFHAPAPQAAPSPEHPPIPASNAPVPHNLPTQPAAYPWQSQSSAAPAALSPEQRPQAAIIKEYGVDPYRETPE